MTTLDFILIGIIAGCVVYDGVRGALRSLATVLALGAAVLFSGMLSAIFPLLKSGPGAALWAGPVNFVAYAVGIFLAVWVICRLFFSAARLAGMKAMDHRLGVLLGAVRGLAVASALAVVSAPWMQGQGVLAPLLSSVAGLAVRGLSS